MEDYKAKVGMWIVKCYELGTDENYCITSRTFENATFQSTEAFIRDSLIKGFEGDAKYNGIRVVPPTSIGFIQVEFLR